MSKTISKKDRLMKAEAGKKKNNPELLLPGNQRANKIQKLKMKKAKKENVRRGTMLISFRVSAVKIFCLPFRSVE